MKNEVKNSETVTITKAEYESFKSLKEHCANLESELNWLKEQLQISKKKTFGSSSERTEQLYEGISLLFNEAEVIEDIESKTEEITVEQHTRRKKTGCFDKLPENAETYVVEHDLSEEEKKCPECGEEMEVIGRKVTKHLEMIPAKVVIREDVYYTYACKKCHENEADTPVVETPQPNPVIKGSFASAEAVAHFMTQKFVMHSPLYRQEQELKQKGIELSRQTMSNWFITASNLWLEPLYDRLKELLLRENVLHADETTLKVLRTKEKQTPGKSYMWLYRTSGCAGNPIVLYDYQPNRKAENAENFLKGFKGWLHTDGYKAYRGIDGVTVVGCWAHARRKFCEALEVLKEEQRSGSTAATGLDYCNKLYAIERKIKNLSFENRQKERQEQSKPLLDAFFAWAKTLCSIAPKSKLGKAFYYLNEEEPYLRRYIEDGRLEIDNNRAERSIKLFVIGRKNWLFANTPSGAKASATVFSIIETVKENGLDPYEYLKFIFTKAPNLKEDESTDVLLPWNAPDCCRGKLSVTSDK